MMRLPIRFSLATFILLISILAVWLGGTVERARQQRNDVATIRAYGGTVGYGDPLVPEWLKNTLGIDYVAHVETVWILHCDITDGDLEMLGRFPRLRVVYIEGTDITDEGLHHLSNARELRELWLLGTRETDVSLKVVSRLAKLESFFSTSPNITPEGIDSLREALPDCKIHCQRRTVNAVPSEVGLSLDRCLKASPAATHP